MSEQHFSISGREFEGHVLWDRVYPGERSVRLLVAQAAADSPVIDRHLEERGRDWIVSPGSYVVAAWEPGRKDPVFSWAYETTEELISGQDGRTHPAFAHVRAEVEDAVQHLFSA